MGKRKMKKAYRDTVEVVSALRDVVRWCEVNDVDLRTVLSVGLTFFASEVYRRTETMDDGREFIEMCLESVADQVEARRLSEEGRLH